MYDICSVTNSLRFAILLCKMSRINGYHQTIIERFYDDDDKDNKKAQAAVPFNALIWLKGFGYQSNKSHSKIEIVNHDIIFWIMATSIQLCLFAPFNHLFICLNKFFSYSIFKIHSRNSIAMGTKGKSKIYWKWSRYQFHWTYILSLMEFLIEHFYGDLFCIFVE